jgi:hypothetical protein
MARGSVGTFFTALGITAAAFGICGAFATAFVDGVTAPFVVLPCYLALVVGCVITAGMVLFRQLDWAKRLLLVALTATLIISLTPFSSLLVLYTYPGDRIHFLRDLPKYSRYVAALPQNGERFAEFNWGGMLFASSGITYDETDEIGRPYGSQSAQWRARMKNTDVTCGGKGPIGAVEPMGEHYYLTSFGC